MCGQVAIVTGSGQGIGAATAKLLAQQGAKVVISDIDQGKADTIVRDISEAGGDAFSHCGDVTDAEFPDKLIKATIEKYGKLNILVNNAGFTFDGLIHKMTDKQWELMLKVHNTAPFRLIRAAAPYMRDASKEERDKNGKSESRCVINISSTSGLHGNAGQINYSTAKSGVLGMTKTIAKEWGPFGVRCNSVAFGMIDTRLTRSKETGESITVAGQKVALGIPAKGGIGLNANTIPLVVPLGRAGSAEEAAGSIALLCSPLASYITGHCLEVTGGMGI